MSRLRVTGSWRATDLLTRQRGRGCSVEPQALTSTCSRQPPPRLRESSLVSTAACGPGCSQGQRGLVTCCWPFMLRMATQTGLAKSGGLSHTHTHLRARSLHSSVWVVYSDTYTCTHFHTSWSHACIHAYRHVFISVQGRLTGAVCAQNTEAHGGTEADRPMRSMWPRDRHINICIWNTCDMGSLPRTHSGSTRSFLYQHSRMSRGLMCADKPLHTCAHGSKVG